MSELGVKKVNLKLINNKLITGGGECLFVNQGN